MDLHKLVASISQKRRIETQLIYLIEESEGTSIYYAT